MRKSEVVVIPIKLNEDIEILAGAENLYVKPLRPYEELVCDFLHDLSKILMESGKSFPDVISFAFWCRKSNVEKLKGRYQPHHHCMGRGLVFHIAPSNVPINFAFSLVFGLLSGNANIVRVPSKKYPQIDIVCAALNKVFSDSKYVALQRGTSLVRYPANDEVTTVFSKASQARVIWGGNETVRHIKSLPTNERTVDISFSDRYSFCVLDAPSIDSLSKDKLSVLAEHFYNDTYLMDQNACSSPHLVIWQGDYIESAQEKFWDAVSAMVKKKSGLPSVHVMSKYTMLCQSLINENLEMSAHLDNQFVYRVRLAELPSDVDRLRGQFGLFYEYKVEDLLNTSPLRSIVNTNYQTLTYFGFDKSALLNYVQSNHLLGIDRIVPVGSALDIGVFWDGYDVITSLSRAVIIS